MSNSTLVSVVMPFLNAERFVEEAIESVFAQTYNNWELLLVDNASTDKSTDIALRYVQQYPEKVRYLQHSDRQNHGVAASRNLGIAQSRGEFIAFLDADDIWLLTKLERQVAVMKQYPEISLIFNSVFFLYEDGKKQRRRATLSPGIHAPGAWVHGIIENLQNATCPSAVLIKKNAIVEVGGFEESLNKRMQVCEDSAVWLKIGLHKSVYYDAECAALYRYHSASCSARSSWEDQLLAWTYLLTWFVDYLNNSNQSAFLLEIRDAMTYRLNCFQVQRLVDTNQLKAAEAIRQWTERLLARRPNNADWLYPTGFCLHALQVDLQEALTRYTLALELGYEEFWVRFNRGSLYAQMGNMKEARKDLERAVSLNPNHDGAQQVLKEISPQEKKGRKGNVGMDSVEIKIK